MTFHQYLITARERLPRDRRSFRAIARATGVTVTAAHAWFHPQAHLRNWPSGDNLAALFDALSLSGSERDEAMRLYVDRAAA